ncbi:hypothetical protein E1287_33045 [Actinomadura sp. KC06]|uniref:hypothetical protein n=1 Tax=Actinomadura sp. KC06 TaxID=2530369 RepID=UPI0010456D7A|nr:hypothetical protein [Actinomadura sp. KC06]TDD28314.1 hypothetical protein E1287_33045 [Actinomadura sp. KC06]
MSKSPDGRPRGRHARPPSEFEIRWTRLAAWPRRSWRHRLAAAGTVLAAGAAIASAAVLALPGGPGTGESGTAAVAVRSAAPPSPQGSAGALGDPDEVTDAVPYFQTRDPGKKVVRHVTDVRRSGSFVRVYTDLGEEEENSRPAVNLCEWTTQFLRNAGDDEPRVFVHGESDGNGSVVLANKQSDRDDCGVAETR